MKPEEALQQVVAENRGLAEMLTPARRERLVAYYGLLERWGAALNLSRRGGPEDWARADVADSFLGLAAATRGAPAPASIMDVGSGAGFPGVAVALLFPEVEVRWVESLKRRVSFLQRVVRELGLTKVAVLAARVEDVGESAQLVTSRATFPWQRLDSLREVVSAGGQLAAFVGREPSGEQWEAMVSTWGWRGELRPYQVTGLGPRALALAVRPEAEKAR